MNDQSTYPPPNRSLVTQSSGGLPTSDALVEASPFSLQEVFSRNPEYLQDRDIEDIVLHMRDLRARLEATTSTPRHARPKADPSAKLLRRSGKVVLEGFDDVDFSEAF